MGREEASMLRDGPLARRAALLHIYRGSPSMASLVGANYDHKNPIAGRLRGSVQ